MSGIIFINYRRSDAEHVAGRLFDRLEQDFSRDRLFFDVDNIPPGEDFVAYLNKQIEACDVLLAIVGPNWQSQLDRQTYSAGKQTKDFVRIEIEAALRQGKKVIPVLVGGVEMPREEDLPETLQPFCRRNAVRLSHERFKADVTGIANALRAALNETEKLREAPEAQRLKRALRGVTWRRLLGGAGFFAVASALIVAAMMTQWGRGFLYPESNSTRNDKSPDAATRTSVTEQRPTNDPVALFDLASLYSDQGRYPEAEALFKRGIDLQESTLGPNHPDLAQGLAGLARLYRAEGRDAEAEELLRRRILILENAGSPR